MWVTNKRNFEAESNYGWGVGAGEGRGGGRGHLSDHFAPSLGPLSANSLFPFDGEDSLSGGSVLQRELADDATEIRHFDVPNRRGRLTEEQQEGVEPGGG